MSTQADLFLRTDSGKALLDVGKALRDQGIALVKEHQQDCWRDRYRSAAESFMRDLFIGDTFIGEDVRAYAMALQIGQPTHPNAWGAMFRSFICAELKTGRVERCGMANVKDPVSHASLCPQYRKLT